MAGRVRHEKEGGVGWVVFDQPERRNAISVEMWEQLPGAVGALGGDPEVRAVVLRGEGDAFVAGADISQFAEQRTAAGDVSNYGRLAGRGMGALLQLEKPLLAAIHGPCVGGGVVVALTADLRFAAHDAVFRIPAARLGLGYEAAGVDALAGAVGWSSALDLLLSARAIDAEEARRIGLVNEVRPAAELDDFVRERARRIAENAPLTLRAMKIAARELRKPAALRDLDA
ncbi:MAG TPA: enoyl-CoA hydratase-related protein, partial [Myxococcota bacterium]|nr:enoyl-CoA hydratase-related protein [Myxococcota bacterium]